MERSPSATMRSRQAIRSDMVSSLTSICKIVLPELGWHGVKLCTDSGIDIGHGNHLADSMDRGTEIHTMKGNKKRAPEPERGSFWSVPHREASATLRGYSGFGCLKREEREEES